jgi:hypothetical protein
METYCDEYLRVGQSHTTLCLPGVWKVKTERRHTSSREQDFEGSKQHGFTAANVVARTGRSKGTECSRVAARQSPTIRVIFPVRFALRHQVIK